MSFEEGFDAIARVKASSEKLGDIIDRIENLGDWLNELHEAQATALVTFENVQRVINTLEAKAAEIAEQQEAVANEVHNLPISVQKVVVTAQHRFAEQQEEIEQNISRLPEILEATIDKKISTIIAQLEIRLTERLRDELKDTRTTLRESFEFGSNRIELRLDEIKKDIIAELPRGLFGRRGS